mmetsp:Transcript_672/g.1575  ORF Transcript_672/g.1575 Transcript_672/m.1575 type:complete len:221 (-) Transcript_672:832-1494(-)
MLHEWKFIICWLNKIKVNNNDLRYSLPRETLLMFVPCTKYRAQFLLACFKTTTTEHTEGPNPLDASKIPIVSSVVTISTKACMTNLVTFAETSLPLDQPRCNLQKLFLLIFRNKYTVGFVRNYSSNQIHDNKRRHVHTHGVLKSKKSPLIPLASSPGGGGKLVIVPCCGPPGLPVPVELPSPLSFRDSSVPVGKVWLGCSRKLGCVLDPCRLSRMTSVPK